jgi:hypothetical protein
MLALALLTEDNFLNFVLNGRTWRLEAIYHLVNNGPRELNPILAISNIDSVDRVLPLSPRHDQPLSEGTTVPDLRIEASCRRSAREW